MKKGEDIISKMFIIATMLCVTMLLVVFPFSTSDTVPTAVVQGILGVIAFVCGYIFRMTNSQP